MKTVLLTVLLPLLCLSTYAQDFAVINDKDGYVNVRKNKDKNAPVLGRLTATSIFTLSEDATLKSEWVKIYLQKDRSSDLSGYIYHDRFKFLSSFGRLQIMKQDSKGCLAKNDTMSVRLNKCPFIPKQHKLVYDGNQEIAKIDGKDFWGTDGEIPKYVINELRVTIKNQPVVIPISAYNDLYEPRFSSLRVFLAPDKTIYIELDNSDGAGAYAVIWVIKDGVYRYRYLHNLNA